ncbi:putative ribonuclease H-like domain-containing protein [Tanacetum coccineum]
MSQRLESNFEMFNKACLCVGSFDHLAVECKLPSKDGDTMFGTMHKGQSTMDLHDKGLIDSDLAWLGHLNFKTMNKLVKGNLVRGLPSKLFENDQTYVACQKGKQHRASCKSKTENSTSLPLHLLHIILNTIDHLGKFDGKADKGFFVGYYLNSKALRVFNIKTRILEENLRIRFSETTPNAVGSGPDWLFDIDVLTRTMNYEPIVASTQSNGFAGKKASDNVGQARKETEPVKDYILLPLGTADPPFYQDPKSSHDDGFKPSSDDGKKVDEDPRKESEYHPLDQVIGDLQSATQTRKMSKNLEEHGVVEPKKVIHALKDPSWIEAMLEELLQFKLQKVWTLVDLPNGKRAIGSKWVFRNKKDKRRIVIRNKARLVAQGYTQEKGIDYDEVFSLVARIEAIRLFLAYASFKDFVVYQMDVKSAFLYAKIEEEVFIEVKTASTPMETQKPLLKDEDGKEVDVHLYRLMIGSLMYLTSLRPDIMFAVCACARYQVNPKVSHLYAMKRIFRYLKGQPKLGLWYPKDSPFDLVACIDSDYAGASLDRKSTIGGCQFLGCRLISWQCKK